MMTLYPLKFKAQLLHKIWGGHTIAGWYDFVPADYENVGEAWVLSDIEKFPTEVVNGSLAGDTLQDLLEVYMDELVGGKVYEAFGNHFPLLLKFIDCVEDLSIQVHPDDDYALENENSLGKTEMWYVLPSAPEAAVYLGWNQEVNPLLIHAAILDNTLTQYMRRYAVSEGDVVYIPAGTVHTTLKNTIVAEIQENSDLTYRLYDYNRVGNDGLKRPLQLDKALDVLTFSPMTEASVSHPLPDKNGITNLARNTYFTTNRLTITQPVQRDYTLLDSFVAYMCLKGECVITALDSDHPDQSVHIRQGEAVLIPASLNDIRLAPLHECELLEVYVEM